MNTSPPARSLPRVSLCAVALLAAVLQVGGCASRAPDGDTAVAHAVTSPTASANAGAPGDAATSQYVIGPGDKLGVFVYESPQLSVTDLPVRPDGRISLPLIPDIVAAGKTPTELGREVALQLQKFVKDPNVSVMVHDFYGPFDRQVRVIGEAADPQALPYREHMTLLDVMIATKGLTKYAAGNSALIVRRDNGEKKTIKVRLADLLKDGDIDQNVEMRPGDTLIIPQSWF